MSDGKNKSIGKYGKHTKTTYLIKQQLRII